MRCLNPRTVGFMDDGKTISWSQKSYSKEYATFQLPCSKCIECRLEYARQWAVRCVHEAKMHENNSFITLTYDDNHLLSEKLQYSDFQKFMKKLRKLQNDPIGVFVTGEYGEQRKRPHWHSILFNWCPRDLIPKYKNERGDQVYSSTTLDKIWGHGITEVGSVTFESAGYCARYAAKKLIHGRDQDHDFHPISKKSSKHAIGKKFLEKYWEDIFNYGHVILDGGQKTSIPRYYEKWLKQYKPTEWINYVTRFKAERANKANLKAQEQHHSNLTENETRFQKGNTRPAITKSQIRTEIINQKFKQLQKHLKGDI